jgi:hypothetical protein
LKIKYNYFLKYKDWINFDQLGSVEMFSSRFIVKSNLTNFIRNKSKKITKSIVKETPKDRFSPFLMKRDFSEDVFFQTDFFDNSMDPFNTGTDSFLQESTTMEIETTIFNTLREDLRFSNLFGNNFFIESVESSYVEKDEETEMVQVLTLGNDFGKHCSCSSVIRFPENEEVFELSSIQVRCFETGQEFHVLNNYLTTTSPSSLNDSNTTEVLFYEK